MIRLTFLFDENHVVEAYRRYRAQGGWVKVSRALTVVLIVQFLFTGGWFIWRGDRFFAGAMFAAAVLLLCSSPLYYAWLRKTYRKSPLIGVNTSVALSPEGFQAQSAKSGVQLSWEAYIKALVFHDGILLFQAPALFYWLPYRAITEGSAAELESLVARRIPNTIRVNGPR
jgi:hypothetical protein